MGRVVITGGAGFIGSFLCERFLAAGDEVVAVDSLMTGARANIAHLLNNPRFSFVVHDITTPLEIDGPITGVLNFASPASPIDYLKIPIETLRVGAIGTENMLRVARAKGARFLHASTSEVYGDPLVHPQPESYLGNVDAVGPRGCYDEAKRYGEAIVMAYRRIHGVDTRIARIFNTYGPRMRLADGRVIPAFLGQALRGEAMTIFGDGKQTRSLCFVDDLVDGLVRLFEANEPMPVNLGTQFEVSMLDLAETIRDLVGSKSAFTFHPLPEGDPKVRRPDTTRARAILGWEPRVSLRDGLARTLPYFAEKLGIPMPRLRI
ncbi:MAG: SDR family oxidoreductase [Deltaproteobacteria bacterium]|nr:SDR family oxidoreductase [Deltaproteobacteria bacterium]